ncbi:hypothetical protein [Plasmodium yoelii yoelii]|uniref:Uncharacterized protein n=1 Tax=Plasmodium yoelii yoelii TaxID=73239 RepID=Q7RRR0_PLAYO|nr:hypothetical protein [Plasmodium yoelii yoelii]
MPTYYTSMNMHINTTKAKLAKPAKLALYLHNMYIMRTQYITHKSGMFVIIPNNIF